MTARSLHRTPSVEHGSAPLAFASSTALRVASGVLGGRLAGGGARAGSLPRRRLACPRQPRLASGAVLAVAPHASKFVSSRESILMMDVLYLALSAALFSLTWGLVRLCERV